MSSKSNQIECKANKITQKAKEKINTDQPTSHEQQQAIDQQVQVFLKSGGEIQKIPSGTSGKPNLSYRKLMTISEKAFNPAPEHKVKSV